MFCRKCGSRLPDDALFCHACGTKIILTDLNKEIIPENIPLNASNSNPASAIDSLPPGQFIPDGEQNSEYETVSDIETPSPIKVKLYYLLACIGAIASMLGGMAYWFDIESSSRHHFGSGKYKLGSEIFDFCANIPDWIPEMVSTIFFALLVFELRKYLLQFDISKQLKTILQAILGIAIIAIIWNFVSEATDNFIIVYTGYSVIAAGWIFTGWTLNKSNITPIGAWLTASGIASFAFCLCAMFYGLSYYIESDTTESLSTISGILCIIVSVCDCMVYKGIGKYLETADDDTEEESLTESMEPLQNPLSAHQQQKVQYTQKTAFCLPTTNISAPLNNTLEYTVEEITTKSHSFFETYFVTPFIRQYADFKSCTDRKAFWLSVLALLIVNTGVTGLVLLIIGLSGMSMGALLAAGIIGTLWSLATIIPGIAICCRRLRDAGKSPWLYLLGLIPLVGPIILLVFLCQESQYDHSEKNAQFKSVDIIITAVSIILLVGGIISLGRGVSDMLGGMNSYDAEYYIDNESENEDYAIAETDEDNETGEILSDDYSASQIVPETDTEFGFSNGMNFFDGNMISKQGKRFPFKLQFVYDTSTGEISNAVYLNVNYGTTIKLTGYENSDGDILLEGKDGRKPFIIQFSGNDSYTGDAWSGDFHQDIELFKQ